MIPGGSTPRGIPPPPPLTAGQPSPIPPNLPEVTGEDWSLGPDTAPVQFLVYSDFQSANGALGLQALLETYDRHPDEIRVVLRHFPVLPQYDKDSLAGQAVEAAGRQGLFWPMARMLAFARDPWAVLPPEGFHEWLEEQAPLVGVDPGQFAADLASGRFAALMLEAFEEATAVGIPGVPTILVNGVPLRLSPTPLHLEFAVRIELLAPRQYMGPPAMTPLP